jgi:hypothetical protein
MLRRFAFFVACLLLTTSLQAAENPILRELQAKGVTTPRGSLKLPSALLADGLSAAKQRAAIETVTDGTRTFDALTRKSVVAPFILKLENAPDPKSTLRSVDLYFVAYGQLKNISEEGLRKAGEEQSPAEDPNLASEARELTADELATRKITLAGDQERYVHSVFPLFDRVRIATTLRTYETRSNDSIVLAGNVDDRFAKDAEFPNQWQSLVRDDAGKLTLEPTAHTYGGAGFYAKATELQEPAGAIFVEYHIVFDEPIGWFNGANLLRSKLPLAAQDQIRNLRRRIEKAERE